MAGKRDKSKGRGRRRKDQKAESPETAAEDAGVPAAEEADDDMAAVIKVDDELEDPDARAELIAAAAGLVPEGSAEGGGEEVEATDDAPAEDVETPDEATARASAEGGDEAEPSDDADGDRGGGEDGETPLIGRDALIALTQFRDEGVATVPEELVLDLGEVTSPDERDRLLAAALAHVEMQEAIYRVPTESTTPRHWKGLIAAGLFILAAVLAVLPPDPFVPAGPAPLSDADRLRGIRTALLVQAEQIEAFRVRESRLPTSLGEVDTALPDIRFVRSGTRLYQLVAYTPAGDAVIYDSAAPHSAFEDVGSPLRPEDAS